MGQAVAGRTDARLTSNRARAGAGSAVGENNLLFHVDDTGTATNTVTLFAGTSANEPTGVEHVTDVVLDPADQLYFLSFSDASGHNGIVVGSLVQGLNSPSATPTFTTLYSDSTHNVSPTGENAASST